MYRVLAIVLMAYAICYPRMDSQVSADLAAYHSGPTRAERIVSDISAWLQQPIDRILAMIADRTKRVSS